MRVLQSAYEEKVTVGLKEVLANCQTKWREGLAQAGLSRGGERLTEFFHLHPLRRRIKTEDVKKLHSGKASGLDKIHPEMRKTFDIIVVSWLTHLFNVAKRSGTVILNWENGTCCAPIIRVSHCAAPPRCCKGGSN